LIFVAITNWKSLYETFKGIHATREEGFEGFIARLFGAETGDTYFVAATGSQPSGDARDERGRVAIQTKAYFGRTSLRKDEAVAQLQRAIRALPDLDIYVLAATTNPAQLRDELAWAEEEFGVDVLLLRLDKSPTELGALAVFHWHIVEEFVSSDDDASRAWAREQSSRAEVRAEVAKIKQRLRGAATRLACQQRCNEFLRHRFADAANQNFNPVDLSEALSREEIQSELLKWWNSSLPENAVLIGDEGMGKTWVGADFANNLSQQQGKIVLWLDSSAWRGASSIADVLDRALNSIFLPGDRLFRAYRRKILRRWQGPLLVVLDGANESNAWRAAKAILNDYFAHHDEFRPRIRLLFTTRAFSTPFVGSSDVWRNSKQLKVGPFSSAELERALAKFAPDVNPAVISADTHEFIRVPMHFRSFLRYRTRLVSVHHLDKRFLLWIEIQEKFGDPLRIDPQVTAIQKASEADLSTVLAELAQSLVFPPDGEPTVPMKEMRRCIPGFGEVREDLLAKKIIIGNDLSFARWSIDHAIVALALLLEREAERHASEPLDNLHELLRSLLEPLPSSDDKVRAIHVAVLLSFVHPKEESVRAALLTLWLPQRNAELREDELSFFVVEDFKAYVSAVEWLFRTFLRGDFETTLIAPLARQWAEHGIGFEPLVKVLQRWLRLVFPGDSSGSKNRDAAPPPDFPVAESEPQLRLSCAAISVLSFRPEISLLPALVDCYRSHSFCYQDSGGPGEKFRVQVKSANDHLGVLVRWHLEEHRWLKALADLAGHIETGGSDVEKIRSFARNLRVASWPSALGEAEDIYLCDAVERKNSVDYLRAVLGGEVGRVLNALSFDSFGRDAVRRDLPQLNQNEIERLVQFARDFFSKYSNEISVQNTFEQQIFVHLLPWLARYSAVVHHGLITDYVLLGAAAKNPADVFLNVEGVPPINKRGSEMIAAIFARMPTLLDLETLSGFVPEMTEIVLLHANAEQLAHWTDWLATKALSRGGSYATLLPLPTAFANYAPAQFFEIAKDRAVAAVESLNRDSTNGLSLHLAKHWLHVACYCAPLEAKSADWAFTMLNTMPANREMQWPIVYLLLRIPDVNVLRRVLGDNRVRQFLEGEDGSLLALRLVNNTQSDQLLPAEIEPLPLSAAGLLFWRRDDTLSLRQWARRLSTLTLAFIKAEPPQTKVVHRSYRLVDGAGLMQSFGVNLPSGGHRQSHYRGSSAWGVDRESETPLPTDEEVDRLLDEYCDDLDRLRDWTGRELAGFNASPALTRWAEIDPPGFLNFSESFVRELQTAGVKTFEAMGTIAWCVATAMVGIDPSRALLIADQWRADWAFSVVTLGGLSTIVTAQIWSKKCNDAPNIALVRRQVCDRALDDEELFVQVLAANRGETQTQVVSIAQDHLTSSRARDRALGITLLAFVDQQSSAIIEIVDPVIQNDASYWVRDQAEWAREAMIHELSCRNRYAELLNGPRSLKAMAAGLAELLPALTPLARVWRVAVEEEAAWYDFTDRARTYVDIFWYHWECQSSSHGNVKIAGRKLKDFCRGEKLKDGVTSRMSPWWDLG
jgi:hypothetical protein